MNKKYLLITKHTLHSLVPTVLLVVIPLFLFKQYSEYPLPYIEYVVIGFLFFKQYIYFDENNFRNIAAQKARDEICKQTNHLPNKKDLVKRINLYILAKQISNGISILSILIFNIFYKIV